MLSHRIFPTTVIKVSTFMCQLADHSWEKFNHKIDKQKLLVKKFFLTTVGRMLRRGYLIVR